MDPSLQLLDQNDNTSAQHGRWQSLVNFKIQMIFSENKSNTYFAGYQPLLYLGNILLVNGPCCIGFPFDRVQLL